MPLISAHSARQCPDDFTLTNWILTTALQNRYYYPLCRSRKKRLSGYSECEPKRSDSRALTKLPQRAKTYLYLGLSCENLWTLKIKGTILQIPERESKFSAKHSSELSAASEARKLDRFIYTTERKGPQAKLFTYQGETKIRWYITIEHLILLTIWWNYSKKGNVIINFCLHILFFLPGITPPFLYQYNTSSLTSYLYSRNLLQLLKSMFHAPPKCSHSILSVHHLGTYFLHKIVSSMRTWIDYACFLHWSPQCLEYSSLPGWLQFMYSPN